MKVKIKTERKVKFELENSSISDQIFKRQSKLDLDRTRASVLKTKMNKNKVKVQKLAKEIEDLKRSLDANIDFYNKFKRIYKSSINKSDLSINLKEFCDDLNLFYENVDPLFKEVKFMNYINLHFKNLSLEAFVNSISNYIDK